MTSFHIALFEPEIPPNTGNIIRLCANTNTELHLIHPLGFDLNEKNLRRAGLDYRELVHIHEYKNYSHFLENMGTKKILACSTKGHTIYSEFRYQPNDILLFGPESRGLPREILEKFPPEHIIKIPMAKSSRSLNLSNAVAIILYEAWRQHNFSP